MNSTKLLELISDIDDKYIEEVRKTSQSPGRKRTVFQRIAVIAACAALTVGCAFAALYIHDRLAVPPSTVSPGKIDRDFVIENGVLLRYAGADTTVTVPDGVSEIASGAFRTSSSSSQITEIKLNNDVKVISDGAFSGLDMLDTITVPQDNTAFSFESGVLSASDGSVHFALDAGERIDVAGFLDTLEKMGRMKEYTERDISFVFGDVVLVCRSEPIPAPDPESGKERSAWYTVKSVSAFGQTFEIAKGKYYKRSSMTDGVIETNALFELFLTDDAVVYEKRVSDFGLAVVITGSGVTEIYNSCDAPWNADETTPTWYNEPVIWFGVGDDGRLTYTRTPRKYAFDQSLDLEIRYCVGRDEFAFEEGTVDFDGANVVYVPENRKSAGEVFDLDKLFKDWRNGLGSNDEELKAYATLDELIAHNRVICERAE